MNISVSLKATVQPDGAVACDLACDGQEARVIFNGTDVFIQVPEPAAEPK